MEDINEQVSRVALMGFSSKRIMYLTSCSEFSLHTNSFTVSVVLYIFTPNLVLFIDSWLH